MSIVSVGDTFNYQQGPNTDNRRTAELVATVALDGTGQPVDAKPGTATLSSVASQTGAIALLAANTARKGASILNTDGNALWVLLASSGTPSATNANYIVAATTGYWEVPFGYTGAIRGAWAADGTGAALVTEYT